MFHSSYGLKGLGLLTYHHPVIISKIVAKKPNWILPNSSGRSIHKHVGEIRHFTLLGQPKGQVYIFGAGQIWIYPPDFFVYVGSDSIVETGKGGLTDQKIKSLEDIKNDI